MMKSSNKFKNSVVRHAVDTLKVTHPDAVRQVEESFRQSTPEEWDLEAYGCDVENMSYGGDETGQLNTWPTASNDGSIAATGHIQIIK